MTRLSLVGALALSMTAAAAHAAILLINGDFEDGNTGFSSGHEYVAPVGSNACCGGLSAPTTYAVASDANTYHALLSGGPQSGELFLAVNGAAEADVTVWAQIVAVTPNTTYNFAGWVSSIGNTNIASLTVTINGVAVISALSPSTTVGLWSAFVGNWASGAADSAAIRIVNGQTASDGNDFGLDNLSLTLTDGANGDGVVPAPAALGLFGLGLLGLALLRRRAA